jgi:hypothetical protein
MDLAGVKRRHRLIIRKKKKKAACLIFLNLITLIVIGGDIKNYGEVHYASFSSLLTLRPF